MSDPIPCPPADDLRRFALGQMPDAEAERLELHLAQCRTCLTALQGLDVNDGLVETVRAGARGGTDIETGADEALIARICRLRRSAAGSPGEDARENVAVPPMAVETPISGNAESPGEDTQATYDFLGPPQEPGEIGRFGPYPVLKVLGTGGMGVVYLAQQTRPRRLVALKVVRAGPRADAARLARFRAEAEVAARVRHPNIVPVYEAGEHQGRPYFTMEYVDGGSLAQKLAAAPLAPRAAAELVETLARAMEAAHERGFVHRDLKPANVLLTADGTPKVTDFGLAKQLAIDLDAGPAACETVSGAIIGTPSYMAPEQAWGKSKIRTVGPAADLYALGVILYELLTGRPPFRGETAMDTLQMVVSEEPVPPRRLQPKVPRDLETVCLRCLHKAPNRRYPSALELADDLGRFLRGEPIRARPVGKVEQLHKWARRKPALAALLAVSVLSLAALVAGGLVYNARLQDAIQQAEAKQAETRRQYRRARDTLNRMLDRLPAPGSKDQRLAEVPRLRELQRGLLEDALAFYQDVLQQADTSDPEVRRDAARAYGRTADVQQMLGQWEAAVANYRRAIELVEALPAEDRDTPDSQLLLAGCYQNWGTAAAACGRPDEAERLRRKALGILERLARARPDDPAVQSELAKVEHNLGALCHNTRPAEAERHYSRAVAIRTALLHEHPEDEGCQAALGEDCQDLGLLYRAAGRQAEASTSFVKAEALLRPLVDRHPAEVSYALSLVALYVNWSYLLVNEGRSQEALDRLDRGIRLVEAALRKEPQDSIARGRAMMAHGARAEIYEFLGRVTNSLKDWDRIIELADEPGRRYWRGGRARVQAKVDHARAVAEAGALAARPRATGEDLYFVAHVYALAFQPARGDKKLSAAQREAVAERYASRAVALLRKLQAQGYFKDPAHAKALRTGQEWQPLRGRADFRQLLAAVGNK
jgi:serine/threonine-protein kinase